jgi:DNA-binding SARP family transcriptional activator/tetratricopeptide (TPR) repeat protein
VRTEFRLLGPIEARVDGRLLPVGHRRQWCVLAALLLDAERSVPIDELVERVWGDQAPQRARETLYCYLSRLRTALAPGGVHIVRQPAGYLLSVDPEAVDVHRFHRLVAAARRENSLDLFEQALELWRGEPFAVLDTPWLTGMRTALTRARLDVELDRNDLALRKGRHAQVLDAMGVAAAAYPMDERLAGQLMLALYRAGRQGEALASYQRVRTRLADDLGIDPGEPLRRLQIRILQADPDLVENPPALDTQRIPSQVPGPPRTFVGRVPELASLSRPAAMWVIVGPGGIGKTWIAQRWAYEHRSRYPDGQLYVDLRGFDPAGPPVSAATAVRRFLDALGVAPEAIPPDLDAQAALYRTLVAERRLLIVLDNARDSAHVAPLLPASGRCTVLVTSRNQLVGLVSAHGARPLTLDLLTDEEARQLLVGHLGEARVAAEPVAVDALLRHCAGLPLALGIVGARAAVQPGSPLAALAVELEEAATRLDALDVGDMAVNLRAVLACSVESLQPPARRLFALLGLVSGPQVGLVCTASLAGLPVAATRILLRQLTAAHLVAEPEPGRFRMHDLVRLYAAEQASTLGEGTAALWRLLDHYLHSAYAADRLLSPFRDAIALAPPAPGVSLAPVGDHMHALAWFAAEHANLLAAIDQAADRDEDTHAWQLAWTLATYLDLHAHWRDRGRVHAVAVAAAQRLEDRSAEAYARCGLARSHIWLGRYEEARAELRPALHLLDALSEPVALADVHRTLARSYARAGQPASALSHDEQALALYQYGGHRCGQATALNAIGWHHAHLGEPERGLPFCAEALDLYQSIGDRHGVAITADSLGYIHRHLDRFVGAIAYYQRAIDLFSELGDRYEQADTLESLGDTHFAFGDPAPARAAWQEAAAILDELGIPATRRRSRLPVAG